MPPYLTGCCEEKYTEDGEVPGYYGNGDFMSI